MTLPVSGPIAYSDINVELDRWPTTELSLNDADVRALAEIASGTIAVSDLYGKDYVIPDQDNHLLTMDGTRLCVQQGITLETNGIPLADAIDINDAGDNLLINDAGDKLLYTE